MGKARFLYNNLITDESMITVSSLRSGNVTASMKDGSGSAVLTVSGNFTGGIDLEYVVECDSIAGGAEVGQATFKWSDGGGTWDATSVTTSSSPTLLNNGVYGAFASGSGADFVVGDRWYFKAINLFSAGKMLDQDRDHRYRSAALGSPNMITINLGSAQEGKAIILQDHNITSAATISFDTDSAATFDSGVGGAPLYSENISQSNGIIVHYLATAQTYRYWRINITDAANPDGYIEIGGLYLGSYFQPSRNYARSPQQEHSFIYIQNETVYGIRRRRYFNTRRLLNYDFRYLSSTDMLSLEAMLTTLNNKSLGTMKPFWFNEDSAYPNSTWFVTIDSLSKQRAETVTELWTCPLSMQEVVASA